MNRWLETDIQKTSRSIINVLNESAAGMVKKEINKDKPEEAPKNKKVALEKRITRAAIKGKKPESKNAKMPKKIAKKVVKEELEPETEKSIEDQIADLQDYLNNTPEIAEDEKEAIQAEIDDLISQLGEDEIKDSNLKEDDAETATFEIDYADDDVDLSTEESVIEDVRNWLGTLANEVKIEVPELSGPAGGWPIVRLIGNKEKIAKFLLDNYNSGGEETLDDIYDLYLQENKLQEDNLNEAELFEKEKLNEKINHANDDINRAIANPNLGKNRDKIHAAGYEVTDYGLIKNPKTKKRIDPSQYSREEKKKVDFKGKLDSERKNNQGRYYPEDVPKSLKTGKYRGYAQADKDDIEAQNGISQNIKDYKAAVETRDENRRWAERRRKNIPHYEKKVKDAQKDLEFQKNYTDELEKDADRMENKRKEILDKARAKRKTESEELKEAYSERYGGDPKDFVSDVEAIKAKLSEIDTSVFGSHLAVQMVEDWIETCNYQIEKGKRLASGNEFYTEADDRTYKDRDEAEYYRNKELYANSNLARHREAMEKAKKACEEKGIKLDEDNYLSRTRKEEPLDLVAYEPEITSVDEVKDKYVKIRGDFHKVIDVKPEGDKFVISFAAGTGTAIGGEFEPATLDEIKRLQLYTENK